jgi:hypothetical protein
VPPLIHALYVQRIWIGHRLFKATSFRSQTIDSQFVQSNKPLELNLVTSMQERTGDPSYIITNSTSLFKEFVSILSNLIWFFTFLLVLKLDHQENTAI